MTSERVTFTSGNRRIFGNLHLLRDKAPCVITLHGFDTHKDSGKWPIIASKLYDRGYACLRFNFSGCGQGKEKSEGEFEDVSLTARIQDYKSAIDFLMRTNEVDASRLGVIGSSFGGMVAIGAEDKRVKAMITMGTPYKIPRYDVPIIPKKEGDYYVLPSGRKFKASFYEDIKRYDLLKAIKSAPPILILHGEADEIVPLHHAYKLYEAASEPKRLAIIKDADHAFSRGLDEAVKLILKWLDEYL